MSLPFNTEIKPCNPENGAHTTTGQRAWAQTMSLDKLRRHSRVFEKKILKAPLKEALIPFKAEEQEEISEESSKNPIDAQLATFCPIKSLPISSMPSRTVADLSEQGHLATGINQTAFSTTCPDTSCISSLKSIVIIFGFLSNLEAHIENSGNVIIVRWVARTKKSYFFIKKKIGRFGKNLEQRLNKKIAAGARYKRQTPKH
jgi:hypothetical protein